MVVAAAFCGNTSLQQGEQSENYRLKKSQVEVDLPNDPKDFQLEVGPNTVGLNT